jgi:ankyrin repeat protein
MTVEGRLLWKLATLHAKIFIACAEGNEKLVESLLNKAPQSEVQSGSGWSALHWASNNGCRSVVNLLMAKGRNISIEDRNG